MKITVLVEDKKHDSLLTEHGLSFFIQYNNKDYLLDAGTTDKYIKNAHNLNISLDHLETCFLSHGHYDHAGGFKALLDLYPHLHIYMMENAVKPNYSISHNRFHEVSIPHEVLEYRDNFNLINKVTKVEEGIYLIPHNKSYAHIGKKCGMYKNETEYDDFSHEVSLVFETPKGLVILNSCSHAGLANIVEEVKEVLNQPVYAYLGGLHLIGHTEDLEVCAYSEEEMKELCEYIKKEQIQYIYTGHCSGKIGYQLLDKYLDKELYPLYTGLTIEL